MAGHTRTATVGESIDPRVLQVAPHDAAHPDVLREALHLRSDTGDSPHDQVHLHTVRGSRVELIDHVGVDQAVHLHHHVATGTVGPFVADEFDQPGAQRVGSDQQLLVLHVAGVAGEVVEQLGEIRAHRRIACEQAEVLVQARGLGVVVAGAHVAVTGDALTLLADHEAGLGVGLEPDQSVDDVHPGTLEPAGPFDVVLFVEARLELHQGDHLLATLGRLDQRCHDRAVTGGAVEGQLDGQHRRIHRRLADELLHRGSEAVIGVVQQDVAVGDHVEDRLLRIVLVRLQASLGDRLEVLVLQLVAVHRVHRPEPVQGDRSRVGEHSGLIEVEFLTDQLE